jgi:hypothetical protein
MRWLSIKRPDLLNLVASLAVPGQDDARLVAILHDERLTAVLRRMFDPNEFLSDYGIRSVSAYHRDRPYVFDAGGQQFMVRICCRADSRHWRHPTAADLVPRQLHAHSRFARIR